MSIRVERVERVKRVERAKRFVPVSVGKTITLVGVAFGLSHPLDSWVPMGLWSSG